MKRWFLPLALGICNVGEYGALAQWGVMRPWEGALRHTPDETLVCLACLVVLATVALGFAVSYATLRAEFAPEVAALRVLLGGALALPCLGGACWLTFTLAPTLFFVLLFPMVLVGLALPFLAVVTVRSPHRTPTPRRPPM